MHSSSSLEVESEVARLGTCEIPKLLLPLQKLKDSLNKKESLTKKSVGLWVALKFMLEGFFRGLAIFSCNQSEKTVSTLLLIFVKEILRSDSCLDLPAICMIISGGTLCLFIAVSKGDKLSVSSSLKPFKPTQRRLKTAPVTYIKLTAMSIID